MSSPVCSEALGGGRGQGCQAVARSWGVLCDLMGRPSFHLSDELGRLLSQGRNITSRTRWDRLPRGREAVTGISVSSLYPVQSPSHSSLEMDVTITPCSWVPHVHLHGFLPELFCFYVSPPGSLQRVSGLRPSPTSLPSGCKHRGVQQVGGKRKRQSHLPFPPRTGMTGTAG